MEVLCRIISLNDSVNWIVLLLVAWATFIICKRLGRNAYYSVGLLMAGCCVLWVLFYKAEWQFIESPLWSISYKAILSAAIIAIITTDLLKLICINIKEWNKPLYAINKMGYTTDDLANLDENAVRRQYARQVMTQLLNTDVSNNSYALAILGEWGSGKSTFLKYMQQVDNHDQMFHLLAFNPWDCLSSKNIVTQFFKQLNEKVSELYSPLEKTLMQYAHLLTQVDVDPRVNKWLNKITSTKTQTLSELKKQVQAGLNCIDRPVVIVIDDIDRLEKNELFEVLRLIRNTGNFANLIYVVAYDERYVVEQLSNLGIYNGRLYLEKIFPTQVALPRMDSSEIYDVFMADVRQTVGNLKFINSCLDSLSKEQQAFLKRGLVSFRKAKHFARQFGTSASFLLEHLGPKGFRMPDLLMMELIRYLSPSVYEGLTNDPNKIFDAKILGKGNCKRFQYVVKDNIEGIIKELGFEEKQTSIELVISVLKDLFRPWEKLGNSQVQWVDKYHNYLCFGIPRNKVSDLEFASMLQLSASPVALDGMKVVIWKWLRSKKPKDGMSVYDQFATFHFNLKTPEEVEAYVHALFYWLRATFDNHLLMFDFLKRQLQRSNFRIEHLDRLEHIVAAHLKEFCEENQYVKVAKCLTRLYDRQRVNYFLYDNSLIENLLKQNVANLLHSKDWDAINLVKGDNNLLNKVVKESALKWTIGQNNEMIDNPCVNILMEFFTRKNNKSNHLDEVRKKYAKVLDNIKYLNSPDVDKLENEIALIFGSMNTKQQFEKFLKECFIQGVYPA